jgi:hypothetical protein
MFTQRSRITLLVLATGLAVWGFSNVSASGQEVVYYGPAPVVEYAAPPVVTYYAPPVVTYSPVPAYGYAYSPVVTNYSPVVTYYSPPVVVGPRVLVPGQPVRNVFRAVLP